MDVQIPVYQYKKKHIIMLEAWDLPVSLSCNNDFSAVIPGFNVAGE